VKEFYVNDAYQNLIFELSQLKQGILKLMKEYKERTMTLHNKLQGCLKAQGHEGTDPIFIRINVMMLEHFTISLLLEL
jgi:hypothetical protein